MVTSVVGMNLDHGKFGVRSLITAFPHVFLIGCLNASVSRHMDKSERNQSRGTRYSRSAATPKR